MALTLPEFRNEPFTDFSTPATTARSARRSTEVAKTLGRNLPALIGGKEVTAARTFASRDPACPTSWSPSSRP